jgi:hypothetical protein
MKVRLTHMDGKLPNLALMKLAYWHREQGNEVYLERRPQPTMFEPSYDMVYASTIFEWSKPTVARLRDAFPDALVGGTGTGGDWRTVEEHIGEEVYENYDYSIYPDYHFSLGFTQRGCRLKCGFCVVPKKEGRPRSTNSILDIWREGTPRCVVLLDNDFFGQPDGEWRDRLGEIREGGFKVNFNQGINIRMITDVAAEAIASVKYYGSDFKARRVYTAWDNLGQEKVFFKGFQRLVDAGVSPKHIMVYMLIGYAPNETMEDVLYRFELLKEAGCLPYPMVYNNKDRLRKKFQRWVVRRYHEVVSWDEFAKRRATTDA